MLKKTPLAEAHEKLNAKMVDFAGWYMPVYYTNVIDEHNTVRQRVGVFDICHMGEFIISGKGAFDFLQKIITGDISKLKIGHAFYTSMCYENGNCVDDLFVYRLENVKFMLVVNAGNIEKDLSWLIKHKIEGVEIKNISNETGKLDIQGPYAEKTMQKLAKFDLSEIRRFSFSESDINNVKTIISRTGYTGEDGFEIYFNAGKAEEMWDKILEAGKEFGIKPIGLGARDTLRIEACYSLYGHELSGELNPVEAGISFVVSENKEYIGSKALISKKKEGTEKRLVCFELLDKGIPRQGYEIFKNNAKIGFVTSGTFSPTFRKPIGMGYVKSEFNEVGKGIDIKIRDGFHSARIVKRPFYDYKGKR